MSNRDTVPFSDIADFKNGLNFKSGETGHALKVLGVGDFQNRTFLDQVGEISTIHTEKEIDSSYHLQDGDLIFVRSNGNKALVGRCMLVRDAKEKISFSGFTIRARLTTSNVLPAFVNLLMQAGVLRKELKKDGRGTNISNLNQGMLSKIEIPLISIDQQREILDFFSNWNKAIEKTEALIDAKERQFGWLRSNIIKNAQNTTDHKFGDFLKESRIPDAINNPEKRLAVRLHLKGVDVREYRGTEKEGATKYFMRKAGQLIYGKQNIFRGSIGIIPYALDGYSSSQDIPAFDIAESVDPDWLYWHMSRPYFYERLELFAAGSGSKRLHSKELFKIHIDVPPIAEQKRIARTLNIARQEITLLKKLANQYRTQKRGLMQKLLSGEWHIKNKEAA